MSDDETPQGIGASHQLGRVMGIEVRVLYIQYFFMTVLILSAVLAVPGHTGWSFALAVALSAFLFVGGMAGVLLHELGHSVAAMKEGMDVTRIYLYPLGGLAQIGGMMPGPLAEIFVALAGPCVSLLLGGLAFLATYLAGGFGGAFAGGVMGVVQSMLFHFFAFNMFLAMFNLLPAFPMDGGRVLLAALVMRQGAERAVPTVLKVAKATFILLGVAGVVLLALGFAGGNMGRLIQGIILLAIALFGFNRGQQELAARQYASLYADSVRSGPSWGRFGEADSPLSSYEPGQEEEKEPGFVGRWMEKRRQEKERREREERERVRRRVDELLDKVHREGLPSLTDEERTFLREASPRYSGRG